MTGAAGIRLAGFSLSFGETTVLRDVSLRIATGETLALIGPSGSGKTTLARVLLGLIDRRAARMSGQAFLGGVDLVRAPERQLRDLRGRRVGMVVQALSDALNPQLTVRGHVAEMIAVHGLRDLDAAQVCLDHNLPAALHHRHPRHLSGGEIQRLLSCLALLNRPDHLVLDEPTAALDPDNRDRAVAGFLKGVGARCQLLISHDLDLVRRMAHRVAVLEAGRIVEDGPLDDILARPRHDTTRLLLGGAAPAPPRPAAGKTGAGLRVQNLSHGFGATPLLRDVSFALPAGRGLAIMGPSGCGKTTLARLLTGFDALQSGQVDWRSASGAPARPARTALIPQHPHRAMARHFTVAEVLDEARHLTGRTEQDPTALLGQVGLSSDAGFLSRRTAALSGGEAQRLVIARALALAPDVLVADEPSSALDPVAAARVLSLLRRLMHDTGLGLVVFTHDAAVARALADRQMAIRQGRLQAV